LNNTVEFPWAAGIVCVQATATAFFLSLIAHTTPAQAERPSGFRFPQFSKGCRQKPLPENRFPRKGCQQPDPLALVVPRGAPTPFAKGSCRAFPHRRQGVLFDGYPRSARFWMRLLAYARSRKE